MEFKDVNDKLLYEYLVNGDQEAAKQLAQKNIGLVSYMIGQIFDENKVSIKKMIREYISVGTIGLMKAINSFDVSRIGKMKFSSYASVCIENEIRGELTKRKRDERVVYLDDVIRENNPESFYYEDESFADVIEKDYSEYKNKKIADALKKLTEKEKIVASLLYGVNGNSVHTRQEIAEKFNVSVSAIGLLVDSIKRKLAFELEEFREEYFSDNKGIDNEFYKIFKKEDRLKVKNGLRYLPKSHYKVLSSYYGLDGSVPLTVKELSKKYDINEKRIQDIIGVSIFKMKKFVDNKINYSLLSSAIIDKYFILMVRYGEERVLAAYERLKEKDKEIIDLFYGDDEKRNFLKEKYVNKNHYVKSAKDKVLVLLEEVINNRVDFVTYKEKFYGHFIGHTIEEVNEALSILNKKEKNIIMDYYGLNCQRLTIKEIAEKYNIAASTAYGLISSKINVMLEMLGENKKISVKK